MKAKSLLAILLSAVMVVPTTVSAADLVAEEDLQLTSAAELASRDLLIDDLITIDEDLKPIDLGGGDAEIENVWVRRIELNNNEVDLRPDEQWQLTARVLPSYANNPAVRWWSDDETIVTVTDDGFVQAVGNFGETWVHCAAEDREGVQADCLFRVGFDEEERNQWEYEDFVSFGGHNYFRYTGRFSWFKAQELAERFGGYLATFTSQEEWDAVMPINDRNLWIGATDADEEGNWEWITGETFDFAPWAGGQPDNADLDNSVGEDYLMTFAGDGFNDGHAYWDAAGGFIVEVDLGWIDMPTNMIPLQSGEGHYEDLHGAASELGLAVLYDYSVDEDHSTRGHDGEGAGELTHFDYGRKYCTHEFPVIVNFSIPEPTVISGIVMTTANDMTPDRNPQEWLLAARATEEDDWTIIAYGDETFFSNDILTARAAQISNTTAYKYFKFEAINPVNAEENTFQIGSLALCTAPDNIAEGSFTDENDNTMNWWIQADGSFILSGHGFMPDFSVDNRPPWYEYRNQIYNFSITEDSFIDRIGDYAFEGCSNLHLTEEAAVRIGSVGCYAFSGIRGGYANLENCGWIGDFAFAYSGIDRLSIPNVVYINQGAFLECHNLHGELVIPASCSEINARAFEEAFNGNSDENRLIIEEGEWDLAWSGDNVWDREYTDTWPLWIQDTAFYEAHFGGGIYLPDRVQAIGTGSFDGACNFGELRLSESLTEIPEGAFSNNNFNGNIEIPERVYYIGEYAFAYSNFDGGALIINDGLEGIGGWAFTETRFDAELSMPDTLRHICDNAFYSADFNGHELLLNEGLVAIDQFAFHGANFGGNLEIPASVNWIGDAAFCWSGFNGELTFLGNNLSVISDHAFANTNWTGSLVIPESVTEIHNSAFDHEEGGDFYSAFGSTLILPENLTSIGDCAFRSAGFSGNLVIPDNVEWIGWEAFRNTGFDGTLTLGTENSHLGEIHERAFMENHFHGNLVIPDSVYRIDAEVFRYGEFDGSLVIGNGVPFVDGDQYRDNPFSGTLTIGNSVEYIADWQFHRMGFTGDLEIPGSVRWIGQDAFSFDYGFTSLTLNEGLEELRRAAFLMADDEGESNFSGSLVIPDSVNFIGEMAFEGADFNGTLTLGENVNHVGEVAFAETHFTSAEFRGNEPGFFAMGVFGEPNSDFVVYYNPEKEWGSQPPLWYWYLLCPIGETVEINYPFSGQDGNLITGTVIGPETGWDNNPDEGAAAALDGNPYTFYNPYGTGDGFTGIDAGAPYILEKVAILSRYGQSERLGGAMIQGSNDGENWITLFRFNDDDRPNWEDHYTVVTEFDENNGYSMFRYYNETNHGDVAEVEFYGEEAGLHITEQPEDCNIELGESMTFSVVAKGFGTLSYRWQYSVDGGENWSSNTFGAGTKAIYTITPPLSYSGRLYRCLITDEDNTTVTSDVVSLTIVEPVSIHITQQPVDQIIELGNPMTFEVVAEGNGTLTYRWQYSTDGGENWSSNTFGAGAKAIYTITPPLSYSGRLYRCLITDENNSTVTSDVVSLTIVEPISLHITQQPVDQIIELGNTMTFEVVAEGNGTLTYRWQYSTDGGENWSSNTFGAGTKAIYTITPPKAYSGRLYRCLITDENNTTATSDVVSLTIIEPISLHITQQPVDQIIELGNTMTFEVVAEGNGTLTYRWQYSTDGGENWSSNTFGAGAKAIYTITPPLSYSGRLYRCLITDENNTTVTSDVVSLTIIEPISLHITQQPVDQIIELGNTMTFEVVAEGNGTLTYRWQYSTDGGENWSSNTFGAGTKAIYTITPPKAYSGRLYRCIVTDKDGIEAYSEAALLTILPAPGDTETPVLHYVSES